jgi:hypothetical protein
LEVKKRYGYRHLFFSLKITTIVAREKQGKITGIKELE